MFISFILCLDGCRCNVEGDSDIAPMVEMEQEALYSAIQGFVGNWWNGSDLYPDPCGWTPIQGVSCDLFDGFWYVTDLNIGPVLDNSLSCGQNVEFRPQMFELRHLKSVSFFSCFTSARRPITIPPDSWDKLATSLQSLDFRSNLGLIGQIPTIFGSLKELQSLVLLENGLTGQIPCNIGKLANLKRLTLSGNRFTGKIPDTIGNLTDLLILDLSRNSLSGSIPSTFGGLISILKLDLSSNWMVGSLPIEMVNLKNLTLLDLRDNNFSGGLKIPFEKMDSLEELVLSHNQIGGDLKSIGWENMQNLMILDLSHSALAGEIPESIAAMKRLRFLDLSNNNLSGNLPQKLEMMTDISAVYVNDNNLTGELKFSEGFYGKMGRRFRAWSNPNLCHPAGLLSTNHLVPVGVKQCQNAEETFYEPDSKSELSDGNRDGNGNQIPGLIMDSSLGFSSCGIDGSWWVFLAIARGQDVGEA
ncbi:hypothetical protein Ancab_018588 [Ancistrocladus abbreviatus]